MMNHDLFTGFFGGAAGIISSAEAMLNQAFNPKSDDITVSLDISLSDVYLSKKKTIQLERKTGCIGCRGVGRVMTQCRACQGSGITVCTVQPFPGYIQQVPQECRLCRRTGLAGRADCPSCHGQGNITEKRNLDFRVPNDCRSRHELAFAGLGHHLPGEEPGDAIIILCVQEHPELSRRGCHLFTERNIQLGEALSGVKVTVKTLDGRTLLVHSPPGSIIEPSSIRVLESEGMPIPSPPHYNRTLYGNLYIKFNIKFPEKLTAEETEKIKTLLTPVPPLEIDRMREDVEEVQLTDYDPCSAAPESESEDDYGPHGPGVQCVHQ